MTKTERNCIINPVKTVTKTNFLLCLLSILDRNNDNVTKITKSYNYSNGDKHIIHTMCPHGVPSGTYAFKILNNLIDLSYDKNSNAYQKTIDLGTNLNQIIQNVMPGTKLGGSTRKEIKQQLKSILTMCFYHEYTQAKSEIVKRPKESWQYIPVGKFLGDVGFFDDKNKKFDKNAIFEFTDEFLALIKNSFSVDCRIINQLAVIRDMKVYIFLEYQNYQLLNHRNYWTYEWEDLQLHFGSDITQMRNFKVKYKESIDRINQLKLFNTEFSPIGMKLIPDAKLITQYSDFNFLQVDCDWKQTKVGTLYARLMTDIIPIELLSDFTSQNLNLIEKALETKGADYLVLLYHFIINKKSVKNTKKYFMWALNNDCPEPTTSQHVDLAHIPRWRKEDVYNTLISKIKSLTPEERIQNAIELVAFIKKHIQQSDLQFNYQTGILNSLAHQIFCMKEYQVKDLIEFIVTSPDSDKIITQKIISQQIFMLEFKYFNQVWSIYKTYNQVAGLGIQDHQKDIDNLLNFLAKLEG